MLITNQNKHKKLIATVNRKYWWRTALPHKMDIQDRGIFLASSFEEAEFYGRPLDTPFRVQIKNPIIGSFLYIEKKLVGRNSPIKTSLDEIFSYDKLLKKYAERDGFDSIIVLSEIGHKKYYGEDKVPRKMELNWFVQGKKLTLVDLIAQRKVAL